MHEYLFVSNQRCKLPNTQFYPQRQAIKRNHLRVSMPNDVTGTEVISVSVNSMSNSCGSTIWKKGHQNRIEFIKF